MGSFTEIKKNEITTKESELLGNPNLASTDNSSPNEENGKYDPDIDPNANLIVNYIPPYFRSNDLAHIFSVHGEISKAKVIMNRGSTSNMGYGFVVFKSREVAMKALTAMDGHIVGNKRIKVSIARPSSPSIQHCKLHITFLPTSYSQEDLYSLCKSYGMVIEGRIIADSQLQRGFNTAFVQFDKRSEAEWAMKNLHGKTIKGSLHPLAVKFAEHHVDQSKNKAKKSTRFIQNLNQIDKTNLLKGGYQDNTRRNRDRGCSFSSTHTAESIDSMNQSQFSSPNHAYYYPPQGMMALPNNPYIDYTELNPYKIQWPGACMECMQPMLPSNIQFQYASHEISMASHVSPVFIPQMSGVFPGQCCIMPFANMLMVSSKQGGFVGSHSPVFMQCQHN